MSGISIGALRIYLRLWRICPGLSPSVLPSDTYTGAYLLTPLPLVCFRLVASLSSCGMSLTRLCLWTWDHAAPAFAGASASVHQPAMAIYMSHRHWP